MKKNLYLLLYFLYSFPSLTMAASQEIKEALETNAPLLVQASEYAYDQELGIFTARGGVDVSFEGTVLQADVLTYNEKTDTVTAIGNVRLLGKKDTLILAHYVELKNHMREGLIKQVKILLNDNSRLIAKQGLYHRQEGSQLQQATYSPCKACKNNPEKPLLWQLRAREVTQDPSASDIIYRDAVLEFHGVPVVYLPYMRHPEPKIKRRSGFLTPALNASTDLGVYASFPYFYTIGPDKDFTFTPYIISKIGGILSGEYRQYFANGPFFVGGSITKSARIKGEENDLVFERRSTRWHIIGKGRFDINNHWRGGVDIQRASDQTYLKKYYFLGLGNRFNLTSSAFAEGFYGRHYANITSYVFQGLQNHYDARVIPVILPVADFNYESEPQKGGGHWNFDMNIMNLYRDQGARVQRTSLKGGWQLPYISPYGDIYTLTTTLRGDLYRVNGYDPSDPEYLNPFPKPRHGEETIIGRAFPKVALDWRYPFIRQGTDTTVIIEPLIGAVVSTNNSNSAKIPNEDSRFFEFDDTNVFSHDRFPGFDLIDSGQRLNFGMQASLQTTESTYGSFLFSQSYSPRVSLNFFPGSGLEKRWSDYVGRFEFTMASYVDVRYRFRLDRNHLQLKRNDASLSVGSKILKLQADYFYIPKNNYMSISRRLEQIVTTLTSNFHEHWSASLHNARDLAAKGKTLIQSVALLYKDECFTADISLAKSFYRDRDLKPDTRLMFKINFKNLSNF